MTQEKLRVPLVDGMRTPFVKAGTVFKDYSLQDLGAHVLRALVRKSEIPEGEIDQVLFGTVLLDPRTPNWAREIVFKAGLPRTVYAHAVSNNCISGLVSMTSLAESIACGQVSVGIAGGTESMSNPALLFSERASKIFLKLNSAKTLSEKLALGLQFRPKDFLPKPPGVTEPSTGLTMGQHMEITAKALGIPRAAQDELALASHQNAARATEAKLLEPYIVPMGGIRQDLLVRGDTSLERLKALKPVFDRGPGGTLTAGNSSPLTDGAAACLLMSESALARYGKEPLAYITAYEYAAIDPNDGLLMAPAVAVPRMLKRLGLQLEDFDLVEVHEAFSAQVLANMKAWEEGLFEQAIGKISLDKLNQLGGSVALGHPFSATGGRIVMHLASELKRRNLKRGLVSICAAGGMAGALVLER